MKKQTGSRALEHARKVILQEAEAIRALADRLDERFDEAVELILNCSGRVIVTGIGKSGHVAKKISATFTSTGTPAFFLHPAEGVHGDLGLLQRDDLLIALSKSGSTAELEMIFPAVHRLGLKSILLTGQPGSHLSNRVTVTLDCSVKEEACPHNLAPTTSSTAALVMGDALAVATLKARNFSKSDFARLHPAGSLGQRLLLKVCDKMHTGSEIPCVRPSAPIRETLLEITGKRLGCALVTDERMNLKGIFTDGDLRRLTQRMENFLDVVTSEAMTAHPQFVGPDAMLDEALALMERHAITALPVLGDGKRVCGIIHLHDILSGERYTPNGGEPQDGRSS